MRRGRLGVGFIRRESVSIEPGMEMIHDMLLIMMHTTVEFDPVTDGEVGRRD